MTSYWGKLSVVYTMALWPASRIDELMPRLWEIANRIAYA